MRSSLTLIVLMSVNSIGSSASAQFVFPDLGGSMNHADIQADGSTLHVAIDRPLDFPVLRAQTSDFGTDYRNRVLHDTLFNGQYGWFSYDGFYPSTGTLWIKRLSQSPLLTTYFQDDMLNAASGTADPLWPADGSLWAWPGDMVHNFYAVPARFVTRSRPMTAQYELYVGDASGVPSSSYAPHVTTFQFVAQPHAEQRVRIDLIGGEIVTSAEIGRGSGSFAEPRSVFFGSLLSQSNGTTRATGPDMTKLNSLVPAAVSLQLAGPLLKLDGAALVPAEGLHLTVASGTDAVTTSAGVRPGYQLFAADLEDVTTLPMEYRLPAGAPDGVYALPVRFTSSGGNSTWRMIVLEQNAGLADMATAETYALSMLASRPGDANFDGTVNFDDLLILAANYNQLTDRWWATGDFDFDGTTNFDDLLKLAANYNTSGGEWSLARASIPEPAGLLASFIGALTVLRRRRVVSVALASTALLASGCDHGTPAAPIPVIVPNAAPTTSPVAQKTASCPLCVGHTIEVTDATPRFDYSGTTYYFCSETCRDLFKTDPKKHAPAK